MDSQGDSPGEGSERAESSASDTASQGDSTDAASQGDSSDESSGEVVKRKKTKAAAKKTKAAGKKTKAAKSPKIAKKDDGKEGSGTRSVKVISSKSARQRAIKKQKQKAEKEEESGTEDEELATQEEETQEQVNARVAKESAHLSFILFASPPVWDPNLLRVNKKLVTTRRKEYYAHNTRK